MVFRRHYVKPMALAVLLSLPLLVSAQTTDFKAHAAGAPLQLGDLPASPLRTQLEALPTDIRSTALSKLKDIHISKADLPFLRVNNTGGVYFVDSFLPVGHAKATPTAAESAPATPAMISSAFTLHSKPGATRVMFLDFDGHTITDTAWNEDSGVDIWEAEAFDADDDPETFSTGEIDAIKSIWRRIAEDYAPFNVDVTTQEPSSFNNNTGRVLITQGTDKYGVLLPSADEAGGIAFVNAWGDDNFAAESPAFVYASNLDDNAGYIADAASHEAGHNLGLSHDGTSSEGYYGGHGEDFISWGPIMGTGYGRHVSQWSQGEYEDANNQQDDVTIITGKLTRRADDHGNTNATATPLNIVSGKVTSTTPINDPTNSNKANKGIIHARGDVDVFSFKTIGGKVTLNAFPLRETTNTRGGNMDIKMTIRNASNNVVATVNPALNTHASFTGNLAAGTYYVVIDGVGSAYSPYSDYGTLGQYFINGTIPQ